MPVSPGRLRALCPLVALVLAALCGSLPLVSSAAPAGAADLPLLVVTEIAPDNAGVDDYEYVELANPGDADVDLAAAGVALAYTYVDSDDRTRDVPLTVPAGTVVPAGGSIVLWLSYTSATVDSFARTEDQFRDHWAAVGAPAASYPVVRMTGQPGMANGGNRGIRVTGPDGASISWSHYPSGSVAVDKTAHFALEDDGDAGTTILTAQGQPTPGAVDPAAFEGADPDPDPDPDPQPDPELQTAELQVTELLPDTSNVGSADGYEFIELYNATSEPIDFGHHTLDYLYPGADLVNTNVVQWPVVAASVTIPPAGTLVVWVKNGQNDHLTDADFNAKFGTSLTHGVDLVETFVGGMANGSPRGMEIVTNTGFSLNKAYYNLDGADDTSADQGIQYATDPADSTRQVLAGYAPASPGSVTAEQVPDGLMIPPADTTPPEVIDHTVAEIDPDEAFTIDLGVTDDVLTRTVTVHVRSDVDDETSVFNLETDGEDRYRHTIGRVDLTGKRWFEYHVVASDGTQATTTEVRRVPIQGIDPSDVRLNVEEGEHVGGTTRVAAAGDAYPSPITLSIDGQPVTATTESLESEPVFAFEATATDAFFRNGVLVGDDVLHIFDEGFYADEVTVATDVPLTYVTQGEELVVSVYAGTKAWPRIDLDENNDDFQIRNMRLVLPDGRTLRPAGYDDPTRWLAMGDSAGKLDFFDSAFTLPADAFTAVAHDWDTTAVADGPHTISATDGSTTVTRTVQVDNTAPEITTDLEEGRRYQGDLTVDAAATDAGSGVESVVAELDGRAVTLPHLTSSRDLPAGEHTVVFTARDELGNTSTRTVRFTTPVEQPVGTAVTPADGTTVTDRDVELEAHVEDPTGDPLDVELREGYRYDPTDPEVVAYAGTTQVAAGTDRGDKAVLTGADLEAMTGDDGIDTEISSDSAFPYQLFEVAVDGDVGAEAQVRVAWDGRANPDAKVLLYVLDTSADRWVEVDRALTTGGGPSDIALEGMVPVADHVEDGTVTVLVQHSEGFAGEDLSTRDTAVEPHHPDDVPRSEYDFTFGWESDTQYYNETYYERQLDIHEYLLDRREELNLQYVLHTGDIVDEWDQEYQWLNADPAYAMFDDAELPYGVLAGNHDVGGALEDYSEYSKWFGADRFAGNPWYGESYQDNRGHYDLITAGGVDLILLYQGWGPGDEEIAWMNEVLARYPERKAIINLHEYLLTAGGLGPIPLRIQQEVVATNPNVMAVTSGHYHDAFTRVDEFDDDGDGTPDRKVTQMLFDYQGLPEGGQAFLRLLHFDNEGGRMMVRTYSPYLDRYNSTDPSLDLEHQQFDVSYADLGITPRTKELATDSISVEVLTDRTIARFEDVESGTTVSAEWADRPAGEHSWYVVTRDPHGAVHVSPVTTFTVAPPSGPSDEELVRTAFAAFVGRPPTPSEVDVFTDALEDGMARGRLVDDLRRIAYDPTRAPIIRLYSGAFDRIADADGTDYWAARSASGTSLRAMARFFVASPELRRLYGSLDDTELVDRIYLNVLDRPADPTGRAYWVDRLRGGTSRGEVLLLFTESPENRARTRAAVDVTEIYHGLLGRAPTTAEVEAAAPRMATPASPGPSTPNLSPGPGRGPGVGPAAPLRPEAPLHPLGGGGGGQGRPASTRPPRSRAVAPPDTPAPEVEAAPGGGAPGRLARFRRTRLWRWGRWPLAAGTAVGLGGLAALVWLYATVELPDEPPQIRSSVIVDANGEELAVLQRDGYRIEVGLDEVSPVVVEALIAAEDRGFRSHNGIDPVGILRAVTNNVGGGETQGASTLTQQLVKNSYLTSERTYTRKVREALLAVKLDRRVDKDEILERYLNTVYFGRGAYGIEAAANVYFDTSAADLDLPQAALLVGLLRAPESADPTTDPETATGRRDSVIDDLLEVGDISPDEAAAAKGAELGAVPRESVATLSAGVGPHVVEWIRARAVEMFGAELVYGGGLTIHTTIDIEDQRAAEEAIAGVLTAPEDPQAALVAVDAEGRIRAHVGGRDFAALQVDLARGTEGGGSGRQPGSTFKPVVLAAALQDGTATLGSTYPAPATMTLDTGGEPWEVDNYGSEGYGEVDLYEATADSVNTVYAQLVLDVGPERAAEVADALGAPDQRPDPSLVLGSGEVSVVEMAEVYSTLSREGERIAPYLIERVEDGDGATIHESDPQPVRALDEGPARAVTHALRGVIDGGTGTGAALDRPAAGKTGTTQNNGDAWFAGYTPEYTAVVWMGYPEGPQRPMGDVHGRAVTGGSLPADIWKAFMDRALADVEPTDFPAPPDDLLEPPDDEDEPRPTVSTTTAPDATDDTTGDGDAATTTTSSSTTTTEAASTTTSQPPTTTAPPSTTTTTPTTTTTAPAGGGGGGGGGRPGG